MPVILAFSLAALNVSVVLLTELPMNFPMLDRFFAEKRSENLDVFEITGAKFFLAAEIAISSI